MKDKASVYSSHIPALAGGARGATADQWIKNLARADHLGSFPRLHHVPWTLGT